MKEHHFNIFIMTFIGVIEWFTLIHGLVDGMTSTHIVIIIIFAVYGCIMTYQKMYLPREVRNIKKGGKK